MKISYEMYLNRKYVVIIYINGPIKSIFCELEV